jgi:hypothetical protein
MYKQAATFTAMKGKKVDLAERGYARLQKKMPPTAM